MSYEEFKNKILKLFLENEWEYHKKFTREEKQEFIDNHEFDTHVFDYHEAYMNECKNYDEGKANAFNNNDEASRYMRGLLDDCDLYFFSKAYPLVGYEKIDESKYPMSYKEFYKILRENLLVNAVEYMKVPEDEAKKRIDHYFRPESDDGYGYYLKSCEIYDKYKAEGDPAYKKIFTPSTINSFHTSSINTCDFWDYV